MNSASTPSSRARLAASSKMKWRLGLLALVAVVVLLPSLFLVVTTISKPPVVMQLSVPAPAASEPVGSPADALTILLGDGNQLYYYFGEATPTAATSLHATTQTQSVRQIIKAWQRRSKATIFIKLVAATNYKALTNILDEMNITGQRNYSVVSPTDADRQLLANGQQ